MQFRNDIQGLRAIAFFLVFIFHFNKNWLSGGFLGVDLFFVISGYLVTSIILHDIEKGKFNFRDFFIKRIKRIIPAYLMMLLVVAIVGVYVYLYLDIGSLRGTLIRSALFVSNHVFASGENYFGARMSENPLLHTWSLSIEMQFYLVLPLILFFLFTKRLKLILLALVVALTVYSVMQIYYLGNKNGMYFSLLARMPEFFSGSLMVLWFKNGIAVSKGKSNFIALFCASLFLFFCFFLTEESNFPGLLAIIPCFSIAVILVLKKNSVVNNFLAKKWLVHFGELSYSLYLWHWPIMAFLRYKYDEYNFDFKTGILIVVLTYSLSWLSYTFIEQKFRKQKSGIYIKGVICGYAFLLLLYGLMPIISKQNVIPKRFSSPVIGSNSHNANVVDKLGDPHQKSEIVLVGDSHAFSLKPFLNYIGRKNHFSFYTLSRNIYPPLKGIDPNEIPKEKRSQIEETDSLIYTADSLIQNNKIIIIASLGFDRLPSLSRALNTLAANLKPEQKLILIKSFPTINKNPIKLNNGFIKRSTERFIMNINEGNNLLLDQIASKYSNVYTYDLSHNPIFDNAPYVNDTIAYFDPLHLNEFGAEKLAKNLESNFLLFLKKIDDGKPNYKK